MQKNFKLDYNPIYFMASLGNGGLVVSVFMYLMFLISPGRGVSTELDGHTCSPDHGGDRGPAEAAT